MAEISADTPNKSNNIPSVSSPPLHNKPKTHSHKQKKCNIEPVDVIRQRAKKRQRKEDAIFLPLQSQQFRIFATRKPVPTLQSSDESDTDEPSRYGDSISPIALPRTNSCSSDTSTDSAKRRAKEFLMWSPDISRLSEKCEDHSPIKPARTADQPISTKRSLDGTPINSRSKDQYGKRRTASNTVSGHTSTPQHRRAMSKLPSHTKPKPIIGTSKPSIVTPVHTAKSPQTPNTSGFTDIDSLADQLPSDLDDSSFSTSPVAPDKPTEVKGSPNLRQKIDEKSQTASPLVRTSTVVSRDTTATSKTASQDPDKSATTDYRTENISSLNDSDELADINLSDYSFD